MKKFITQISLILVLLSNKYLVNTNHIQFIDIEEKWIKIGEVPSEILRTHWFLRITNEDIETIKSAMGVYKK